MVERASTTAGKMIRNARIEKGWSQRELGKMLGYDYGNFVGMIEVGKSKLPIEKVPLISELLGINPKQLFREVMIDRYPEIVKYI